MRGDYILKRVLSGLLIMVIILEFMNPMLSEAKKYKYVTTTINVRSKPSMKGKIIGQLYWNDKVKILKKISRKWYQIQYKKRKRYVCAKYLRNCNYKFTSYFVPSVKTFKSYEDADCITNNEHISQGKLKSKYHLDYRSGVWMIGNRYCIAVGSYYTKKIGVKIDLVLSPNNGRKHTLKCITADSKADKDTVNKHRIHKDGSVVEFIVKTKFLSKKVKTFGDVSYAGKKFTGKIIKINVYK